jgi:hypothetical protein
MRISTTRLESRPLAEFQVSGIAVLHPSDSEATG